MWPTAISGVVDDNTWRLRFAGGVGGGLLCLARVVALALALASLFLLGLGGGEVSSPASSSSSSEMFRGDDVGRPLFVDGPSKRLRWSRFVRVR